MIAQAQNKVRGFKIKSPGCLGNLERWKLCLLFEKCQALGFLKTDVYEEEKTDPYVLEIIFSKNKLFVP